MFQGLTPFGHLLQAGFVTIHLAPAYCCKYLLDYKKLPFFASIFRETREGDELMNKLQSDEPSPERLYESKQTGRALRVGLK